MLLYLWHPKSQSLLQVLAVLHDMNTQEMGLMPTIHWTQISQSALKFVENRYNISIKLFVLCSKAKKTTEFKWSIPSYPA